MSLRGRVLGAGALLVLLPLLLLALIIRGETSRRLREQYTGRVDALVSVIASDVDARGAALGERLAALGNDLSQRNDVRLALAGRQEERAALLDWASQAMQLAGLDALQLHDGEGRILSCGHFRNDYGRVDAGLPDYLLSTGARAALVSFRRPSESFLALARADTLRVGTRSLVLVAGLEWNDNRLTALSPDPEVAVSLVHGSGALSSDLALAAALRVDTRAALRRLERGHLVRELPLAARPALRLPHRDGALLVVTHSLAPMRAVLRGLDLYLALTWIVVAGAMLVLALRLSRSIARPLEELTLQTEAVDLESPRADFATGRDDEVGTLSRFLSVMMARLRASAARLRDAERRATFGELARQVNHDLKNAFTPLRNVVRHLSEVSDTAPHDLPRVYAERRATLDAGIGYLEDLATSWGRLSHPVEREPCDVAAVVDAVTAGRRLDDGGPVRVNVAADAPRVLATPVGLRRIVENLVANACECLEDDGATVTVTVDAAAGENGPAVRIEVADEGSGIPEAFRARLFDPFTTTKPHGSGLGLAIVRRLVSDFEGTIRVESREGAGTTFTVTLPASGGDR